MAWYRAGTVAVTNGSAVITGAATAWVGNVQIGHAINLPDGRAYEVLSVDSNAQITLGSPYLGGTASGQPYSVQPNQGFAQTAATRLTDYMTQVSQYVTGPLAGRFGDGSFAAPGVSFSSDQDTGITRSGANLMSAVTGGVERMRFGEVNSTYSPLLAGAGVTCQQGGSPSSLVLPLDVFGALGGSATMRIRFGSSANAFTTHSFIEAQTLTGSASDLRFGTAGAEQVRIDANGNLLVGASAAANHVIARGIGEGDLIIQVQGRAHPGVAFFSAASGSANGSACAFALNKNSQTSRSINAAGTINASGADYAEYMVKAAGCGIIAKSDVCGVDRDGKLTKTWADAISFVVKSTDPSLVGGDTWAAHMPPRPEQTDDEADAAFATRLAGWEASLEQARLCVDRVAFCGQVPCNVTGDFSVGDYIIAAASGAGIKAVAIAVDDMTLAQYMRRIGKVWAVRDGRAWIDVQHG